MLWLQALTCFCAWIAYGIALAKSSRAKSGLTTRKQHPAWGAVALVAGMLVLVAGLYGIGIAGGVQQGALTGWAWAAVLMIGMVFVHLQSIGALILFRAATERETRLRAETSVPKEDHL